MTSNGTSRIEVEPVVNYPRQAQPGSAYLMTVDLRHYTDAADWPYEAEEYVVYCMLDTTPLFSNQPVGEPALVLHRFGGTYGPATFLLTASNQEMEGAIRVTLVSGGGVPLDTIELSGISVAQRPETTEETGSAIFSRIFPENETQEALTDEGLERVPGEPLWNVPHPSNPSFTGREAILWELQQRLGIGDSFNFGRAEFSQTESYTSDFSESSKGQAIVALVGRSGMGKTAIALELAYRHRSEYDVVWWARADSPEILLAEYAGLAGSLGLEASPSQDYEELFDRVRSGLEEYPRWLLVLDNAGDASVLDQYLPQSAAGHIVITSRDRSWTSQYNSITVGPLEREESAQLLEKLLGITDTSDSDVLADTLEDVPQALEQAAAFLKTTSMSISEYDAMLRRVQDDLVNRDSFRALEGRVEAPVAATWEVSLQYLSSTEPLVADILRLGVFLGPDALPRLVLEGIDPALLYPTGPETIAD